MSAGIRADAGGISGAIQVGGVDRLTLNADGSLVASANPATGLRSQALATMQKFADEFVCSLATNGYQKLPSGLIIQWGTIAVAASAQSVTLPVAFSNADYRLVVSAHSPTTAFPGDCQEVNRGSRTSSQFQIGITTNAGAAVTSASADWLAIGY